MDPIQVMKREETADGWRFVVEVGQDSDKIGFCAFLDEDYWKELTDGRYSPDEFVIRSFRFLLAREPRTSIQRSFHIRDIQRHFATYEGKMKGQDT